jgi:hypothetical protein
MQYKYNKIFIVIYFILMIVPLPYLSASVYSYYSVRNTFGQVPDNDTLYKLLREGNRTLEIFPTKYGEILLILFSISFLIFPLFILANYLVNKQFRTIHFFKKYAIILTAIYALAFILAFRTDPFGGWYLQFMVD